MKNYLNPKTDIADAALTAYDNGQHLEGKTGTVRLAPGRDSRQAITARKVKALQALRKSLQLR
jgi:hypothetical protein